MKRRYFIPLPEGVAIRNASQVPALHQVPYRRVDVTHQRIGSFQGL